MQSLGTNTNQVLQVEELSFVDRFSFLFPPPHSDSTFQSEAEHRIFKLLVESKRGTSIILYTEQDLSP